LVVLVGC
jgi:hypothetical protein